MHQPNRFPVQLCHSLLKAGKQKQAKKQAPELDVVWTWVSGSTSVLPQFVCVKWDNNPPFTVAGGIKQNNAHESNL